jgi:hypothetical protein
VMGMPSEFRAQQVRAALVDLSRLPCWSWAH